MKSLAESIYSVLRLLTLLPHIVLFATSSERWKIMMDLERWTRPWFMRAEGQTPNHGVYKDFVRVMTCNPEFRSLFYCRIRDQHPVLSYILKYLCTPPSTLFVLTPSSSIGPGLFILHGFSTVVLAKSIGSNCMIGQQVTIGFSLKIPDPKDCPTIGDNVTIMPGAMVFGGITIGSNSTIGANAVVNKDVPENCTVIGVPACIIRRNGAPTIESL